MTLSDYAIFGGVFLILGLFFYGIYALLFGGENPNWPRRIYTLLVIVFLIVGVGMFAAIPTG